jgi:hypothetical protein
MSFSLSPAILQQSKMVSLSSDAFPEVHFSPQRHRDFIWKHSKKQSCFICIINSLGCIILHYALKSAYPVINSGLVNSTCFSTHTLESNVVMNPEFLQPVIKTLCNSLFLTVLHLL